MPGNPRECKFFVHRYKGNCKSYRYGSLRRSASAIRRMRSFRWSIAYTCVICGYTKPQSSLWYVCVFRWGLVSALGRYNMNLLRPLECMGPGVRARRLSWPCNQEIAMAAEPRRRDLTAQPTGESPAVVPLTPGDPAGPPAEGGRLGHAGCEQDLGGDLERAQTADDRRRLDRPGGAEGLCSGVRVAGFPGEILAA